MAIIDKYPGAKPIQQPECAGYCCHCLQMVFWNADRELIHILSGENRCQLYATLKNEENQ